MSQPRAEGPGSEVRPRPDTPPPQPTPPQGDDAGSVLFLGPDAPGDDTPTVISRNPPRPPAADDASADGLRGRHLAHFELLEPIGYGGMAAVLRARDTQLDRIVALKILPPEMAADPENVRRFHHEARSAAKLDHENIARVFFCGEDQRLHFIAFEFVEGENLRTVLERRGRLPVGEALHYMLQVAAGLAHAARRGVVHRDIKPSNIIITPNGRAKLVDMGLARSLEPQTDHGLTHSGVTLGTFDYISPEQALEPREADVRSDIYSLGCTFYHMLTGRPPVPEGTAAKKLHHHQHVKPTDPRRLAADIPDEVAVILDRMMAKDAKDRYQSPEQLVHHLLLAARKLGATPEIPEGVLSVEADLPNPPGGRPLLLAALAAAAVVGLVLLLDQTSSSTAKNRHPGSGPRVEVKDKSTGSGTADAGAPSKEDKRTSPPAPADDGVAVYTSPDRPTLEHLQRWLKENRSAARVVLNLAGDLDLSPEDGSEQGLSITGRQQVTIKARNPAEPPTLHFHYSLMAGGGPRVALTVQSQESLIQNIRFVVDLRESHDTEMIGLRLVGGARHRVHNCEFIQAQASFKDDGKRLASLVADAGRGRPEVTLSGCCFLGFGKLGPDPDLAVSGVDPGGQDAVVRRGPAKITAENCAFGPHAATFRLDGTEGTLVVKQCSVLAARRSAVFDLPGSAGAALEVTHSLFSRWGEAGCAGAEGDSAVLIRQGDPAARVTFQGRDNRYHNLDGYWLADGRGDWGEFQRKAHSDTDSRVLVFHPWKEPPEEQFRLLENRDVVKAFGVNERLAPLRQEGRSADAVVGTARLLGKACTPVPLPPLPEKPEKVKRYLVVEPRVDDSSNGVYPRLDQAILAAAPGDTILVRHDGSLAVKPVLLDTKGTFDLTVRPYRGFRPVLTLGETSETDTALFRLHDGKLRLEGLEFLLRPGKREFKAQALVALVGDGECTLENCVVTLDRAGHEAALAVATLTEAGKVMKVDMPPARSREQGPRLALSGCLVRGDGDLLWGRTSRPCELSVKNTLAALGGSFLNVEVPPDAPAAGDAQRVDLQLTRVTTYLAGHLIRLSAGKDLKGLVPVRCRPDDCLFVPTPAGKSLVHIEGMPAGEKALKEKLEWSPGGPNGYGTFESAVEQQPSGEEMPQPMNMEGWKRFGGEERSTFDVKLDKALSPDAVFAKLEPGQFKHASRRGADLAALARLLRRAER